MKRQFNREFLVYEHKLAALLLHHLHKYRYVGEEGKEYELIQGIFSELNRLNRLANIHIRWYAVIINLWRSFQQKRFALENRRAQIGFDLSLLDGVAGVSMSVPRPTGVGSPEMEARLEKGSSKEFFVPSNIPLIERLVNDVARMGMLAATKETIDPSYLGYKLTGIHSLLSELLKDMENRPGGGTDEEDEEVYFLTINNAAENAMKIGTLIDYKQNILQGLTASDMYRDLIAARIQGINKERLASYHNMDAFWNGFIP